MRLSRHFTMAEMTRSETAARLGLDNYPPAAAINELKRLCTTILEPVRGVFGPLQINSGYRAPEVNASVPGSSPTSSHCWGGASDFEKPGDNDPRASARIVEFIATSGLPFDQVIYEYGAWVHVGISRPGMRPRRQVLMKFANRPFEPFDVDAIDLATGRRR